MGALQDQVAIITGGGSGIGRAAALALAGEGARVALVGRREERLRETAALLEAGRALCCPCDVTDRDGVSATIARILEAFGRVDILVNNAGTNTTNRATATIDPAAFDQVVAVNMTGAFNMTQAVLPTMRAQQSGLVINVSSIAGIRASALVGAAYAASKHGMAAMVNVLADEEQANGIRATAICPGECNTEIIMTRPEPPSEERLRAMLQPEDVGAAVLFVASLPPRAAVPMLVIKPQYQVFK